MPLHEHGECFLIALAHEKVQQLAIGPTGPSYFGNAAALQYLNDDVGHTVSCYRENNLPITPRGVKD
jgi:hypothetical protein